jgi:2-oxopent-4-enoate hydratase
MIQTVELERIAGALHSARCDRRAIPPISESWPGLGVAEAYAVQRIGLERRLAEGARLRGHKIGLTARVMQRQLGVDAPDYGYLLDDMIHAEGSTIPVEGYIAPRIEPELAFMLRRRLTGPGVTAADVLRATEFVCPALELIDSRIAGWRIKLVDTVADNASSAGVVLAGNPILPSRVNLRFVPVVLSRNGELCETGAGAAVLGNPVNAVAWLANALGTHGVSLDAGQLVLAGSFTASVAVSAGDRFGAEFGELGQVCVAFR